MYVAHVFNLRRSYFEERKQLLQKYVSALKYVHLIILNFNRHFGIAKGMTKC